MAIDDTNKPRRTNPAPPANPQKGAQAPRAAAGGGSPSVRPDAGSRRAVAATPAKGAAGGEQKVQRATVRPLPNPGGVNTALLPIARAVDPRKVPHPINTRPIPVKIVRRGELPEGYEEDEEDTLEEAVKYSPALVASVLLHLLILVAMALYATTSAQKEDIQIIASAEATDEEEALDDSVVLGDSLDADPFDPGTIAPDPNLPIVSDPLSSPSPIVPTGAIGEGAVDTSSFAAPNIGIALKGRHPGTRGRLLGKFGGTPMTESAVSKGLEWLARQQRSDGLWSLSGPYTNGALPDNQLAATAMALLAFQGHGDTHKTGKYAGRVATGWNALLKFLNADGKFTTDGMRTQQVLYTQAQCTIALCELYGMTGDEALREPAERAIAYCVKAQDKANGGWKYDPGMGSDVSVTGWFVMALQSARMAKIAVPQETLSDVTRFLDVAQKDGGRTYSYERYGLVGLAVSAEGLLCRQYLGWKQNDPRLIEGMQLLLAKPITYSTDDPQRRDVYYWYYATQVAHHLENPVVNGKRLHIWDAWNAVLREQVPAHQVASGPESGSWDPAGDKWGSFGGRLYVTCLSIYMLEVYYRHLPIYSGLQVVDEEPAEAEAPVATPSLPVPPSTKRRP